MVSWLAGICLKRVSCWSRQHLRGYNERKSDVNPFTCKKERLARNNISHTHEIYWLKKKHSFGLFKNLVHTVWMLVIGPNMITHPIPKDSIKILNLYKGSCYFSQFALTFNTITKAPNHARELSLGIVQTKLEWRWMVGQLEHCTESWLFSRKWMLNTLAFVWIIWPHVFFLIF